MGKIKDRFDMLHWNYLREFWNEQSKWSQEVFGPDNVRGPLGPTKHLAREVLTEILGILRTDVDYILDKNGAVCYDLGEFVDCMFLVVDACRRAGFTCEQFTKGLFEKLAENKAREWPKFNPNNVNEAVEHIRTAEQVGRRVAETVERVTLGTPSNMEVKSTTPDGGITIGPIGDDDPTKQITSNPIAVGCRVVSPTKGWTFEEPHFVDSEDCQANRLAYWRVWASRPGRKPICGVGVSPEQALETCKANVARSPITEDGNDDDNRVHDAG